MDTNRLRVLIANEHLERLQRLEATVLGLGHDVIASEVDPRLVPERMREHHPDLALVGLGDSCEHALALIAAIGRDATCPVIAVLHAANRGFVASAADAGVFAAVSHDDPDELHGAIVIAVRRFAAFSSLNGAFGRRAVIERAKGILMERHGVGEREAFELLRRQSQHSARKLIDIATAVNDTHRLLPAATGAGTADGRLYEVELVDGDESEVRLAEEWPYDVGTRVGIGDSVWRVTKADVPIDPRLARIRYVCVREIERARDLVQSADALVSEATQIRRRTRARRAERRILEDPQQP